MCRFLLSSFFMATLFLISVQLTVFAAGQEDQVKNPEPGKARNILKLDQEKTDSGIRIRVIGDGKLDMAESRSLYDPPRLVVDFPGVLFPQGPDVYTLSSDAVRKIRISRSNPDKTRLVFDLPGVTGTAHQISKQGNILIVEFSTKKEENTKPIAKITEPVGNITIRAGRKLSFAGTVTGGNEPILREWTFSGNGILVTMFAPEAFRFEQPGVYEITYRATDREGDTAADTITVRVQDTAGLPATSGSSAKQGAEENDRRFGLSIGTGLYHTGNIDDFIIVRQGEGEDETWSLSSNEKYLLVLGSSYRLTRWFDLNADFSFVSGGSDYNLFFGSAGPRIMLPAARGFKPYLKAAVTYGQLDWSDAPGDFDEALGWEFGYGILWASANWNIGADLLFRNIEFDYTEPSSGEVSASSDRIDFSGFGLSLSCSYLF